MSALCVKDWVEMAVVNRRGVGWWVRCAALSKMILDLPTSLSNVTISSACTESLPCVDWRERACWRRYCIVCPVGVRFWLAWMPNVFLVDYTARLCVEAAGPGGRRRNCSVSRSSFPIWDFVDGSLVYGLMRIVVAPVQLVGVGVMRFEMRA